MIWIRFFLALSLFAENMPWADLKFESGPQLKVEVAKSFFQRTKGLMGRTDMPANEGMLFVFHSPQRLSFWMKDTYIPLSIAYLDKDLVIKEIHQLKPQSMMEASQNLISYPSQCECQYALEVNQGWFKKHKVKVGDRISYKLIDNKK